MANAVATETVLQANFLAVTVSLKKKSAQSDLQFIDNHENSYFLGACHEIYYLKIFVIRVLIASLVQRDTNLLSYSPRFSTQDWGRPSTVPRLNQRISEILLARCPDYGDMQQASEENIVKLF
jgi:hypothetical protein